MAEFKEKHKKDLVTFNEEATKQIEELDGKHEKELKGFEEEVLAKFIDDLFNQHEEEIKDKLKAQKKKDRKEIEKVAFLWSRKLLFLTLLLLI